MESNDPTTAAEQPAQTFAPDSPARRAEDFQEVTPQTADAVPTDEGAPEAVAQDPVIEDDPELPYRITRWNGIPNYECRECPYATVEGLEAVLRHINERHGPPPAELMQDAGITLYDQYGREIPRAQPIPEGGE